MLRETIVYMDREDTSAVRDPTAVVLNQSVMRPFHGHCSMDATTTTWN